MNTATWHPTGLLAGALLVLVVLWEAFETIVLPRRVTRRFRLTRAFYRGTWAPWRALGRRLSEGRVREGFLSVFGPISLLLLLGMWTILLVLGFTLLHWGAGSGVRTSHGHSGWLIDLYVSGATLFTLTPSDISPVTAEARLLTVIEAGAGLGLLALVIGYLPTLSQAFSRREVNVSLLDARAGSPPSAGELLLRQAGQRREMLTRRLQEWELWCAELMETHVSFPVLAYFRSQHTNQSWVAALTAVLDLCAILLAGADDESQRAARLTFAMGRHAAVDLAMLFRLEPRPPDRDRLPASELVALRRVLSDAGIALGESPEFERRLQRLRALYEPYMNALASFLLMPLPDWHGHAEARDNWRSLV